MVHTHVRMTQKHVRSRQNMHKPLYDLFLYKSVDLSVVGFQNISCSILTSKISKFLLEIEHQEFFLPL